MVIFFETALKGGEVWCGGEAGTPHSIPSHAGSFLFFFVVFVKKHLQFTQKEALGGLA